MAIKGNYGQEDFLIQIDGIKGESRHNEFKDQIEVESWSFGLSQTGSFGWGGPGGGAGKAQFRELKFVTKMSVASPKLHMACASGQHIPKAILTCCKAGGAKQYAFYTVTLTDVLVSGYKVSAESESVLPLDHVTLSYAKVEVAYATQAASGNMGAAVKAGWDLNRNVPV